MSNLRKKIGLAIVGVIALLGIANKNVVAFDNIDKAPLFLEHGNSTSGTILADHESHYSHSSHVSHASHASGY